MASQSPAERLNDLLSVSGLPALSKEQGEKFTTYLTLLQKWNQRTNLTAIRDEEGILKRHFLESIFCSHNLPTDIYSLLDYGSGAGFPGVPIALIRNDLSIILAESQNKKAAFLREAVRSLELTATVHSGRAEELTTRFDCITLRAVDQMETAIIAATRLLNPSGWLAILTTAKTPIPQIMNFNWANPIPLPKDTDRVLLLGRH